MDRKADLVNKALLVSKVFLANKASLAVKADAVKKFPTYVWFRTGDPGEYDILCAEYCGLDHSKMLAKLKVVARKDYDAWLAQEGE